MSPPKEEVAVPILAKQNPETGAKLLRKLSRAQLHLWQEIGRRGISLTDLEIRHAGRDMREEVRQLEELQVVILEELPASEAQDARAASGQTQRAAEEEEEHDPRVRRGPQKARKRPARSTAAVEKSALTSERPRRSSRAPAIPTGRNQRPTEPARTDELAGDEMIEDTKKSTSAPAHIPSARPSGAVAMPARNPKSQRKRSRDSTAPVPQIQEETAAASPVAARRRTSTLSAAIERPTTAGDRRTEPSEASAHQGPGKGGARQKKASLPPPVPTDAPKRRRGRSSAAIERPTRTTKRERVRRPTADAPSAEAHQQPAHEQPAHEQPVHAHEQPAHEQPAHEQPAHEQPAPQTSRLQDWATNASTAMGGDDIPLSLDRDALKEWAARGTKAVTKPAMPAPQMPAPQMPAPQAPAGNPAQNASPADTRPLFADDSISIGQPARAESELDIGGVELKSDGLSDEERELMKLEVDLSEKEKLRIIEVARAVKSGDICGMLGLESTAKRKAIKRAYYSLSQELHPDQYFGRNLGGFKRILEQAFISLAQYVKALNDKRTTLPSSFRDSKARRKSQRFHVHLRAQVQCESWGGPEWTVIQDISDGGTFLITNVPAILGEPIRINVDSPNGTIGIVGKVVSMREPDKARRERRNGGLGVQFENAAAPDYQLLKELLAEAKKHTPAFTASAPIKSLAAQKLAKSSRAIHRQKSIIGIDLGTTNTAVSAVIDNRVQIVPWPDGSYSMPSVVSFPERGRCVTGYEAQRHLVTDPRNVINSGKRLVGRQYDDPEIASYMADARFKNYKGPDGTIIAKLWGEDYAIPQICSYLFSAAKHAAETALGKEPQQVVITVPVSFESGQIDAMRLAAKLAQLEVVEVIEEPCAAAIANQGQKDFKGIVGVYDFGGGTFDFSLVEAGTGDLKILATTGDSWLGGDDFDLAIADAAANMFWKAEGTDLRQKAVEWQQLIYACEQAKRELSRKERAQVVVPDVTRNAQGPVDLRINLTRSKVELLWSEPIRRSIDTCKQALSLAGVPIQGLSAIYLSGGTSYIPAIRRALMQSFGVPVHLGLAPEHAVCAGAGIRAAILQGT